MTDLAGQAAAQAWLARLPLSERLAAHAHTEARLLVWLGAGALLILAAALLGRSGLVGRLARTIEAARPRPWLASAAAAALTAATLGLVQAAYDLLVARPVDGADIQPGAALAGVARLVTAAVLVVPALQWLFRMLPRAGPEIAGLVAAVLVLAVGWGPYALLPSPPPLAPPGPVTTALRSLIVETGLPADGVRLSPDPAFDADVAGGFGRARVVIGRQVLGWPPAEAAAYVGHIAGHYRHGDIFAVFLINGLVAFAALAAIGAAAGPLARRLGAAQAKDAADPRALPAAAILVVLAMGAATLAGNGYLRWANVRADQYSLDHVRAPDGLAGALERRWDHEAVDPAPVAEAVFYSHPPLARRLEHAMAWKAAHGG